MTTTVAYSNFINVDARFGRPYQPGDRLVLGHRGQIEVDDASDLNDIAEQLFVRHNGDDRPDGQLCPSMSVGDVILIGETAVSVASRGFHVVHPDPDDLLVDRPWSIVVDEPAPSIGVDL